MFEQAVSVLLGHASVDITLNRYVHALDGQKRKAMEILLSPSNNEKQRFLLEYIVIKALKWLKIQTFAYEKVQTFSFEKLNISKTYRYL